MRLSERQVRFLIPAIIVTIIVVLVVGAVAIANSGDDGESTLQRIDSGEPTGSSTSTTTTTVRPTTTTTRPATTTTPPTTAAPPPAQPVSNTTPAPAQQDNEEEQAQPAPAPEPTPPAPAEPLCDKPVPTTRPEVETLTSGYIFTENCGLSFRPSTDCPYPGPVVRLEHAQGFQPGQQYYSTIWHPDGRYYTPDQGTVGTVNADGSLPWRWTCEAKDQPLVGDAPYVVLLEIPSTGQWIAFKIMVAQAP